MKYSQTGLVERPRTPSISGSSNRLVATTLRTGRSEVLSPNIKKYSYYRPGEKSLSPVKLSIKPNSSTFDPQKEYMDLLKEEKDIKQKLKSILQDNETLVNIRAKGDQELRTKKAKFEDEKAQSIELFADFVVKKNIGVEFPRPVRGLGSFRKTEGGGERVREKSEGGISRSGPNSPLLREVEEVSTGDSKRATDECNFLVKFLLKDKEADRISSNLRVLNRAANLNV